MIDGKLLTLIKVAEEGSFSRAAKSLGLTQPAVSNHIKTLESELNCQLFIRNNNVAKLTDEGEIAVHYAKRMEALYARMDQKIADYQQNRFSLSIGITHTAQNSPIVEAIAKYAAEKGGVHINFVSGYIKELYEQLDEYVLDMAVVEGSNEDPSFNSVLLDTDTLLVAMSPRNHLASKATLTLDDLRKEKLILRSKGSATRSLFEASLESHESHIKEFDVLVESESLNVIKDLVMKDSGVSILPASSCVSEVKKGKLVLLPIIGLPMTRQVNIVVRKSFKRMDILDGIVSSYRKMMGEAI